VDTAGRVDKFQQRIAKTKAIRKQLEEASKSSKRGRKRR